MPSDTAQLVLFPSHWEYIIFTMAQLQSTTILCSHTVMLLSSTSTQFTLCTNKLYLLKHQIHIDRAPQYLVDYVQSVTCSRCRRLRSTTMADYIKRTTRTSLMNAASPVPAQQHKTPCNHIF